MMKKFIDENGDEITVWSDGMARAEKSAADMINSPPHYTVGDTEPIDLIESMRLGYHAGNVIKYVSRYQYKGRPLEDLQKARAFLNRLIDIVEAEEKNK